MKRNNILLLCLLLSICTFVNAQKSRVINNPKSQYNYEAYDIKKIEITSAYTIVDMRVSYTPNYWFRIDSITTKFKESNGDRTFKLIKSNGYELNKQVFMPESGYIDGTFYFESIPADIAQVDLIESDSKPASNCYNIELKSSKPSKLDNFLGNWITNDGSNQWIIGITEDKVLYKNDFWTYSVIKCRANNCVLKISKDSVEQTVYLKKLKNGDLLFKEAKNAKELACSKDFTFISKESEWVFNKNNYEKEIFKPGKSLIRGYWEGYTPKLKKTSLKINAVAYEKNKDNIYIAEINEDGTFELEIDLNYPIVVFVGDFSTSMYLQPNDTLLVSFNLKENNNSKSPAKGFENKHIFMGNRGSADLNNFTAMVKDDLFELPTFAVRNEKNNKIKNSKDPIKEIFAYRDEISAQMDRIISDSHELLMPLQVDDYVKDQLVLDHVASLFIDLLELHSNYTRTKYTHTQRKDGSWNVEENKSFKEISVKEYYNFVSKYDENILNNILNISSNNTWVIFNRYEYSAMVPRMWEVEQKLNASKNKEILDNILEREQYQPTEALKSKLEAGAQRGYLFADKTVKDTLYNKIVPELTSLFFATKTNITAKDFYLYSDSTFTALGGSNNFLYQTSVVRTFYNNFEQNKKDKKKGYIDTFTKEIIHAIPLITNDYLRGQLIRLYRESIQQFELNVIDTKVLNPKAEAVYNKIIAPYKGNVIFMDFWGIYCGPCRAGMISAKSLVEELKSHKIKFLYVSSVVDSPEEGTNKFLKENNIKGENIRLTSDEWSYISQKFGVSGIPHTVLIDKDGRVVENKAHLDKAKLLELEKK